MGEDEQEFQRQQINCRYASRIVQLGYNKNLGYNDIEEFILRIRADFLEEMQDLGLDASSQKVDKPEQLQQIAATPESLSQSLATQMIISQENINGTKKQAEVVRIKRALSENLLEEELRVRHSKRVYVEVPKSII